VKIIRADSAGFCFGVKRAYELALQAVSKQKNIKVATLGELIHNPEVLEELHNRGIKTVKAISKIRDGIVIIRAHGISQKKMKELKKKNIKIVDASCPFVKKIHMEVANFIKQDLPVVILGKRQHPELLAILEDFPNVEVVEKITKQFCKKFSSKKIGLLAQTTETSERFLKLKNLLTDIGADVVAKNTICNATRKRQNDAISLAKKVDIMIVVGGKKSNNTKQLFELVSKTTKSFWVENVDDLQKFYFDGIKSIGICAGASTPEAVIKEIIKHIEEIA
jgi:(E)-4-hydroxy-3-methyl-but-2-enyl pyrophosphate reductase